jgi:hypothetical protein
MAKKTIKVTDIVEQANAYLALPEETSGASEQFRRGVIAMVERVLFETGNYKGFNYLKSELLPESERDYKNGKVLRDGMDETRRFYYHPLP